MKTFNPFARNTHMSEENIELQEAHSSYTPQEQKHDDMTHQLSGM